MSSTVANLLRINLMNVMFSNCQEMKNYKTFIKDPGFQRRYKMMQR